MRGKPYLKDEGKPHYTLPFTKIYAAIVGYIPPFHESRTKNSSRRTTAFDNARPVGYTIGVGQVRYARGHAMAPSSSGLGRHPLKVKTAGSNPAGVTIDKTAPPKWRCSLVNLPFPTPRRITHRPF